MNIEIFFDEDDLKPILANAISKLFQKPITPEELYSLRFERDDEGDITGVTVELSQPPDKPLGD